jgi:phosphate transport system protein
MPKHLQREIEKLKKQILAIGAVVEESLHKAVRALQVRDERLAKRVIESDIEIDRMEVDMEEDCLKVLALHQPVASDLRLIVAILKINNDLERIGDLAVNIAERAVFLSTQKPVDAPLDFAVMVEKTEEMLRKSLDALVDGDATLAHKVCLADDDVDAINREMHVQVQEGIRLHPDQIESLIHLLSASRHLERVVDHATNIAEDVIYMIEGHIVRHKEERFGSKSGAK